MCLKIRWTYNAANNAAIIAATIMLIILELKKVKFVK